MYCFSHPSISRSLHAQAAAAVGAMLALSVIAPVIAQGGPDIITALQHGDTYISPRAAKAAHLGSGADQQLRSAASYAASRGVDEKLAIVYSYPTTYPTAADAAHSVRASLEQVS